MSKIHWRGAVALVSGALILASCTSSDERATNEPVSTQSSAPATLDSCDANLPAPNWPRSGPLASVTPVDAPSAARQIVAQELGVDDVVDIGELEITGSACRVHVRSQDLDGEVGFIGTGTGLDAVGFNLGGDAGLSLQVQDRHVTAVFAGDCTACTSFEMRVRYGNEVASVPPQPDAMMQVDLLADPSVTGGYVFVARAADGSIRYALATAIHAGDFAAS